MRKDLVSLEITHTIYSRANDDTRKCRSRLTATIAVPRRHNNDLPGAEHVNQLAQQIYYIANWLCVSLGNQHCAPVVYNDRITAHDVERKQSCIAQRNASHEYARIIDNRHELWCQYSIQKRVAHADLPGSGPNVCVGEVGDDSIPQFHVGASQRSP
jgi:hypothetical protein